MQVASVPSLPYPKELPILAVVVRLYFPEYNADSLGLPEATCHRIGHSLELVSAVCWARIHPFLTSRLIEQNTIWKHM